MGLRQLIIFVALFCAWLFVCPARAGDYLSPTALAATDKTLFIACATANRVVCLDLSNRALSSIALPLPASGLALSADGGTLFVTCAAPVSQVCLVDLKQQKITGIIAAGHSACAPVLSADGKTLYVCNQFDNDVSVIDVSGTIEGGGRKEGGRKEVGGRIPVRREPVAADITRDGKFLLVANHLPAGRADVETVAAVVSVIDLATRRVVKELPLPNGSGELKDLRVSPDGKYAAVSHVVASFSRATSRVDSGWMNANGLTILDLARMEVSFSLLLDEPARGAANPWGLAWSADGDTLAVAHAGTHEVSLINFPQLLAGRQAATGDRVKPVKAVKPVKPVLTYVSHYEGMDPGLPFLTGARERVKLPSGDLGPRALVFVGQQLYVANYYSDTLTVLAAGGGAAPVENGVVTKGDALLTSCATRSVLLGPKLAMDAVRQGDLYFHDATLCLQGWQSCASCHPGEARVDGFNWDLLNDGIGNPKSTRSLLLAFQTPPAMFLGVRTNADAAVRAGLKSILFTHQPDAVVSAIDAYVESLKPVPSPHLVQGRLSKPAKRGQKIFRQAGCADCHEPGLFTDLHAYDVGTRRTFDRPTDHFYTPTLIEVWRTAPYLHDGSAATLRDVLTTRNPKGEHGAVSGLSNRELDDLCEYVLSL